MIMGFFRFSKRMILVIIGVLVIAVSYFAYLNSQAVHLFIDVEPNNTFSITMPISTFDSYGNYIQMFEVNPDVAHQLQTFIPNDDIEYFMGSVQPNMSFVDSSEPLETVQNLVAVVDTLAPSITYDENGHTLQMFEVSDDVNHLITTFTPNTDIEYFIGSSRLSGSIIQDLSPIEDFQE